MPSELVSQGREQAIGKGVFLAGAKTLHQGKGQDRSGGG
jgi:hypothetical protein